MHNPNPRPSEKLRFALINDNLQALNEAISKGADVNAILPFGNTKRTPLHIAALIHDPSFAQALLKAGADPNAHNIKGWMPLHLSALNKNPEVAKTFLEATEQKTKDKGSDFRSEYLRSEDPRRRILDRMLAEKRTDVNIVPDRGFSLMYYGLRFYPHSEQPAFVRALLDAGLEVDKQHDHGAPLYVAARHSANPAVIEILLHAGADANADEEDGYVSGGPLHRAALHNSNPAVVQALLDGGADVNKPTPGGGWTPLHCATEKNENPAIMEVLLEAGANANVKNGAGGTALHTAIYNIARKRRRVNLALAKIKMLITGGADVNTKNRDGQTPLHFAISAPVVFTKWLIYADADPNAQNNFGETPLHMAVCHGSESHTKFLLDNKADIEARDHMGNTPLLRAVKAMKFNSVRILLDAGADAGAKDRMGKTTLEQVGSLGLFHSKEFHEKYADVERILKGVASKGDDSHASQDMTP